MNEHVSPGSIFSPIPLDEREQNRLLLEHILKSLKRDHGIAMTDVAKKLNISIATLDDRRTGRLLVRNETLFALQYLRLALSGGERWEDIE